MSYGKVKDTFWTDKKMRALSDDARMLALYFLTGPHRNILGCMRVPDGYLLADLGWSSERLSDAIEMLSECGFICRDDDGWTLILNQLKHDPPKIRNHALAATRLADEVPRDSIVYQELVPRLVQALEAIEMASLWHPDDIEIPLPSPEPLPEPSSGGSSADADPPPEREAVDAWNQMATETGLPSVQKLTETRRKKLRVRLRDCGGIEGWRAALAKVRASPFLLGDNDRRWKADFDFLLSESKFTKLMEGGYDRDGPAGGNPFENIDAALEEKWHRESEQDGHSGDRDRPVEGRVHPALVGRA